MFSKLITLAVAVVMLLPCFAKIANAQIDQAKPGEAAGAKTDPHAGLSAPAVSMTQLNAAKYAAQNRASFERDIRLDQFRLLSIQNLDQIKIIDSWARQSVRKITRREFFDGKDPVYLALDMALRPEAWMDKNFIFIESVPIREELAMFAQGATAAERASEARRIREEARVSPAFLWQDEVRHRLDEISRDSRQLDAVNKVYTALDTFFGMGESLKFMPPPPSERNTPWSNPADIVAGERQRMDVNAAASEPAPPASAAQSAPAIPPYTPEQKIQMSIAFQRLVAGWQDNDAALANPGLAYFALLAQSIDSAAYPSNAKRVTELWYNRTYSGTIVAFIYFAAMVLFFLVAVGITRRVEKTALRLFAFALVCHISAMGVRWWINGRIPIQNQFESVMGSACIGCIVGFVLERWKKNGIFGTAFSFVGFLAATVLLAAPYVFGKDLGAAPSKVAGILANTYWLYIHVNIVIASYALISASAAIAGIYLLMRQWYWVNPLEPGFDDPAEQRAPDGNPGLPRTQSTTPTPRTAEILHITAQRNALLDTLDQANMVVLQMAFWFLGIGVMCGAVWADQSWGRPWGWDPKETFALVTWIVYLIIVHVRLVIKQKADTTAWLTLAGFGVMLFNWIGVNFFLKGLHSYA